MTSTGWQIAIPRVRNGETADIILEQHTLCEEIVRVIRRVAKHRQEREVEDAVRERLRCCHAFLGVLSPGKGCLYREVDLKQRPTICEHAVPTIELARLYLSGAPFNDLAFYPVARISRESDRLLSTRGLRKKGQDTSYPFRRYASVGIKLETHEGALLSCQTWSMADHWALLGRTEPLRSIRDKVTASRSA